MTIDFESLITNNSSKIRNIARSYTNFHDYEDLMQEILTQLWRSHSRFRGDSKVETWLYRIAINTAVSYQRTEIKQRKVKEKSIAMKSVDAASQGLSHDEILHAFISTLNEIDRAVLMMYLDGLTASEMESVLGIKANAIKVRISRLKVKFREQFVD
ncbi:RNA polymerase sigma factor [Aliikangiella coralliicola]|uniref:RNA polymerase sigma factor n=1 Tax=Aliikangiella coralliicola TaxID=2592383 RepID=A0A545UFS6_9GAMM|nr:RNA polymerase sigma factor [Aliikangiella coralliicola]TQV88322.1 RNA polymerase sigma factor [Aliikangiella coralliicola]